ncbi:3-carboxy-cis,cis-muconate cycloisomerase [Roseovarius azorensis]|uniref:3-carboxy-cis,cis-muconate cycloisomerase n=1 Tax=Roseovarius azorensis TaxID=1287727 RepID=A0A1H7NBH9_9RHOB|nr:3-carboxy-cis,cis-muconate cycloisomerase [Roseovarius azorensis]SEL20267.1 3-carboxy-cis,cis-muconate cycloisomerase [Roseovarius azorensis]
MISVFDGGWMQSLFADAEAGALWSAETQMGQYLAFEAAWSRALGRVGLAAPDSAERAAKVIERFAPDMARLHADTARDGLPVPGLVRQLREAAAEDADAVHRGATSQDVMDTGLSLTLRALDDLLLTRLARLQSALSTLVARFGDNTMMGRTRMQAALPIPAGHRVAAWAAPLDDHAARLTRLRPMAERLQLGGAVGTRDGLDGKGAAMAAIMADALGLHNPAQPWHTDRSGLTDYGNCLSLITGSLGKMGQDICLMAQQGVNEIALAQGGGSSAMPHKSNPILAELLVTLARFNATQVAGLHQTMVHEQERSGAAWALEWMILPQMTMTCARALSAATTLCERIDRIGAPVT